MDFTINAYWQRCHPGRLRSLSLRCRHTWCRSPRQSIMKWVFMQQRTQFKLMLSLSTDRICNQSTTRGPRGQAVLMKSEGKRASKNRNPAVCPHLTTFLTFFFLTMFDEHWQEAQEAQPAYSQSFERSVKPDSETEGSCVYRSLLFPRGSWQAEKRKLTKC